MIDTFHCAFTFTNALNSTRWSSRPFFSSASSDLLSSTHILSFTISCHMFFSFNLVLQYMQAPGGRFANGLITREYRWDAFWLLFAFYNRDSVITLKLYWKAGAGHCCEGGCYCQPQGGDPLFFGFTVKSLNFKVASGYQVIVVVQGYFTFKMCANNDTDQDPRQECFDR